MNSYLGGRYLQPLKGRTPFTSWTTLMEQNQELRNAWDFVEHTGISIFLTGKAGTGKTTFLRTLAENSTKRSIVVAPTGVAAINAGGVTIHSFFQLPPTPFVPEMQVKSHYTFSKEKRKIMRTLDMLIIDEISMVRADLLDAIDNTLRRFREHDKPFGGVQLLMIGDLQQLTPVVTNEDEQILRRYYDTPYFFGSHALRSINYVTIELTQVFRQQHREFIDLLNHIRDAKVSTDDIALLNSRYNPTFQPGPKDDYIRLTTHNQLANDYNAHELARLKGVSYLFNAVVEGTFPEYSYPTNETLELKEGTQVMFIKNDSSGSFRYYNGRIGHVVELSEKIIRVLCPGDDEAIDVVPETWMNARYTLNDTTKEIETTIDGTFTQYPLRLAWAITIHKSQGLTFEHCIIDANASFAPEQVYVAMSRCKTLEGIVLASPIHNGNIFNDYRVEAYIQQQQSAVEASIQQLPTLKDEYYRQQLLELFNFKELLQLEETLARVMIEHFYKFPKTVTSHRELLVRMREKIMPVADKWASLIRSRNVAELKMPEFLDRVSNGADYFGQQMKELFEPVLDQTKMVKSENKQAMKRLATAFDDLEQSYLMRRTLLCNIIDEGFSVTNYLYFKQRAVLHALDITEPDTRKRTKKADQRSKNQMPKPKKEDTKEQTLYLFNSGMSPDEIAMERNLKQSTICHHLAYYVANGELITDRLISQQKRKAIRALIAKLGDNFNKTLIKTLCRPEVTYSEIDIALAEMRHDGLLPKGGEAK